VIIDNDNTELSSKHIKNMLLDTGDIIMRHRNYLDDDVAAADAKEDETVSYAREAEVTSAISSLL